LKGQVASVVPDVKSFNQRHEISDPANQLNIEVAYLERTSRDHIVHIHIVHIFVLVWRRIGKCGEITVRRR
jgi:hypothetical protein